jgi:glyoxylase-like metal-dependent hydrolase (beta-lactamase superfamily II)
MAGEVASAGRVSPQPLADKGFASVRKVGDGVYATISDLSKGLETVSNGGFIVGTEAALLIEGFRTPAGASFQFAALRQVSEVPVRAALDTHYHFDHTLGNTFYGAQGIAIWAHEKTAPLMVKVYGPGQEIARADTKAGIEKRIKDAKSEAEREHAKGDLNAHKLLSESVESTVVSLPNRPLEPSKLPVTVDLGGIQAVIESYPGHTPSDLIVRVPQRNIVFTGDLLFNAMYPATFDANLSGWRKTLGTFSGFDKETLFVPGHGPLCGPEGIATLRSVFDDLAEQAARMYKAGIPVEEAQQRYMVPERFKGFPIFAWSFCIGPTIAKYYEEFMTGGT